MQNNNSVSSETNVMNYIFRDNSQRMINDFNSVINKIVIKLTKQKQKEVSFLDILMVMFFGNEKKDVERLRKKNQLRDEIEEKIKNLNVSLNIFEKLNETLMYSDDLIFNIEELKYEFNFQEKQFCCKKLKIIYDKNSSTNLIDSIGKVFSLIVGVENLNKEIDHYNQTEAKQIKAINLQDYVSFSSHPCLQIFLDQECRQKYTIVLDRNNNIQSNEDNLKLMMILKLFYFYTYKINKNYGEKILSTLGRRNQNENNIIQTKIVFDIATVFFQKCLEFYFMQDKESFKKYTECIQAEVNLFFKKELKADNEVNFEDDIIYELMNSLLFQIKNLRKNVGSVKNNDHIRRANIYVNYDYDTRNANGIDYSNIIQIDGSIKKIDGSITNIEIKRIGENSQVPVLEDNSNPQGNFFASAVNAVKNTVNMVSELF